MKEDTTRLALMVANAMILQGCALAEAPAIATTEETPVDMTDTFDQGEVVFKI